MNAKVSKDAEAALNTIIRRVPRKQMFDSHTIIELFADDTKLQTTYRRYCEEFGVTFASRTKLKRAHSELSKMIGKNPLVEPLKNSAGKQWDAFSPNVNEGVNANKVWKFKEEKGKGEPRKKLQSEE